MTMKSLLPVKVSGGAAGGAVGAVAVATTGVVTEVIPAASAAPLVFRFLFFVATGQSGFLCPTAPHSQQRFFLASLLSKTCSYLHCCPRLHPASLWKNLHGALLPLLEPGLVGDVASPVPPEALPTAFSFTGSVVVDGVGGAALVVLAGADC